MVKRIDPVAHAILIDVHDQINAQTLGSLVAELDHFSEFPRRIDVQEGKRRLGRIKSLHGQMEQDGRIRATGDRDDDSAHRERHGVKERRQRLLNHVGSGAGAASHDFFILSLP